jgi:NADPH:quinone reductase-like Zn-dependent oxidoreductase
MPSAKVVAADLNFICEMLQDGRIAPSIEARFPLERTPEALAHLATGRTRGKLIIDVNPQ